MSGKDGIQNMINKMKLIEICYDKGLFQEQQFNWGPENLIPK